MTTMLDRAQTENVLRALQDVHFYMVHPDAIRPCTSKRVATHRVPNHEFAAIERRAREALRSLNDILHADPIPT